MVGVCGCKRDRVLYEGVGRQSGDLTGQPGDEMSAGFFHGARETFAGRRSAVEIHTVGQTQQLARPN